MHRYMKFTVMKGTKNAKEKRWFFQKEKDMVRS